MGARKTNVVTWRDRGDRQRHELGAPTSRRHV